MINDEFLIRIAQWINQETASVPAATAYSSSEITVDGARSSIPSSYDYSATTNSRSGAELNYNAIRKASSASALGDYINSVFLTDGLTGSVVLAEAIVPSLLQTTTFDFEVDWNLRVTR